jgi:hypothetical protein
MTRSVNKTEWLLAIATLAAPQSFAQPGRESGGGLVITGFAGADRGTRGRVKAFDSEDGSPLWTFYTIPGPEEPGYMPAFGASLTPGEVRDVSAHVVERLSSIQEQ